MTIKQIQDNLYFSQIQIPINKDYDCDVIKDILHDVRINELLKSGLLKGELIYFNNIGSMKDIVRYVTIYRDNSIINIRKILHNSTNEKKYNF